MINPTTCSRNGSKVLLDSYTARDTQKFSSKVNIRNKTQKYFTFARVCLFINKGSLIFTSNFMTKVVG